MARKKSKSKRKSSNPFEGGMGGMDGMSMGNMGGMSDMGMGGKSKKGKSSAIFDSDMGMGDLGMGDFGGDGGLPATDMGAGMGNDPMETMGSLEGFEVEYDDPNLMAMGGQRPKKEKASHQDIYDMFNLNQKKDTAFSGDSLYPEVGQAKRHGKNYVQDPQDPENMIPISTYKKRYGKSTAPKRQTRNNVGNRNINEKLEQAQVAIGQMRNATQKATSFVKDRLANRKYQPDGKKMKVERKVTPVKYSVNVTFDDGSSTQLISNTLIEAKTRQRSLLSDPHVTSAEINYI